MELKAAFIQKVLADYNKDVIETMRIAMRRAGVGVSDEAYRSLAYQVFQSGGGAYSNLSFKEYLRFVDMGVGRGHPLGGLTAVTVTLQASKQQGLAQVKDKIRKPRKIYSKIAYGKLVYMENRLLHGFTEEAIAAIKQELTSKTQSG